MAILRTIQCSICKETYTEPEPNAGWKGWGILSGIVLDGDENPCLCPAHLKHVANFVNEVKHGLD